MSDFRELLHRLLAANAEFILVGGVAATVHGSSRLTDDVDVVYRRTDANIDRVVAALADLKPYLRGAPAGLPFKWDRETIARGLNFTLITELGAIDLLGEITGGGTFEALVRDAVQIQVFGGKCLCLDLPTLIRVKRAAGRPKDLEAVAELEALLDTRSEGPAQDA